MGRSPRGPVCPRAGPVQRHDGDGGGAVGDVTQQPRRTMVEGSDSGTELWVGAIGVRRRLGGAVGALLRSQMVGGWDRRDYQHWKRSTLAV
jgi:hypothetical protein